MNAVFTQAEAAHERRLLNQPQPVSAADVARGLHQEALDAFQAGPEAILRCPAYGKPMTLTAYLNDSFAGPSDGCLPDLIRLVKLAAESSDPAVRISAQTIIVREAQAYAKWHQDDARVVA